jgi:hypothetical protein
MSSQKRKVSELELAKDFRVPRQITDVTICQFLSSLDTPRALTVWLLYSYKEHDQLSALEIEPEHYWSNPYMFRIDYTATNFLAKSSFLQTSFDRKQVALEKFQKFETLCNQTNRRFLNPSLDPLNNGSNVWLLNATKRKILEVLGDFDGDEFVDDANWGPGVSTLIKGEEVSGYNKFRDERGITRDLYSLVATWFPVAYPSWHCHLSQNFGESWQQYEVGNSIVTVPKNSKTDRVIAIEPGINLWFQKAIGSMIRRRLLRVGIDLNDQSNNQALAWVASRDNTLATVDFSSASDSISLEVVRELLPPRWFTLLDTCRSKVGLMSDGSVIKWNKFSSMGNGFTFELESLIFYAAAKAVHEYLDLRDPISVFGDDVILSSTGYHLFSEYTEFPGFRVNRSKNFYSGGFRESCGSHYYSGVDCKPIFLKERLSNVETIYKLANSVRLLAHRSGFNRFCDARFRDIWSHLLERVPEPLRFKVPVSAGDTGFISNFDEASPTRARYGIEGYYYRALVSVGITRRGDGQGLVLAQLRRLGSPGSSNPGRYLSTNAAKIISQHISQPKRRLTCLLRLMGGARPDLLESNENYTLRGRARRKVVRPLVHQWYNLGGWD